MDQLRFLSLVTVLALAGCDQGDQQAQANNVVLETQAQKISYIMGMDNGKNMQSFGLEIDRQAFHQGLVDGLDSAEPQLSEEQINQSIETFKTMMTAKREEMQLAEEQATQIEAEANSQEGAEFLEQNAAKEGVVTTESGLQYKVLVAGTGAVPTADSQVEVHYVGRLLDGTEFDSSIKRGVPAQFAVNQVISGWTEALQLMAEGSKWQLYIPSDLAYGPGGTGPIGPNAVLIFDVELLQANVKTEEN